MCSLMVRLSCCRETHCAVGNDQSGVQVDVQVIEKACNVQAQADIAAVIMTEGLANICLVTDCMTVVRQKIEVTVPRKRISAGAFAGLLHSLRYDVCCLHDLRGFDRLLC